MADGNISGQIEMSDGPSRDHFRPKLFRDPEHIGDWRVENLEDLHDELFRQRDSRSEARGFRRGIIISLASCGLVLALSTGAFLLLPYAEGLFNQTSITATKSSVSGKTPPVGEMASAAVPQAELATDPAATFMTTPPTPSTQALPLINIEHAPRVAASGQVQAPAGLSLS